MFRKLKIKNKDLAVIVLLFCQDILLKDTCAPLSAL